MIPKENLYKESKIKFNGVYCNLYEAFGYIERFFGCHLNHGQSMSLHNFIKSITEENLFFPLDFLREMQFQQDKKGCRIYDWKILTTPQVKNAMNIHGDHIHRVQVAHCVPMTMFINDMTSEKNVSRMLITPIEKYDKFLNVTYLVNDEFLQDWCNPHYENNNVATKIVKECSTLELLFAIKKKINKESK